LVEIFLAQAEVIARPATRIAELMGATAEFNTIRLRLIKIAARITEKVTCVRIAFASACPDASLFLQMAGAIRPKPS
jgi:hypothetical protein